MKRIIAVVTMIVVCVGVTFGLPSIAVLDAILSEGVDSSVQIPVTEKVIEELVMSGKYTVLDRGSIAQVLEEKKFQLSGIVADNEVRQAGEYLGADFVSVVKVSLLGTTYFISAKMINVESGAIDAQVSRENKGEIEVVLQIAKDVGVALVGGEIEEPKEPEAVAEVKEEPKEEPKEETVTPAPAPAPYQPVTRDRDEAESAARAASASNNTLPKSRISASFLAPSIIGDAWEELAYIHDIYTSYWDTWDTGVEAHILQTFMRFGYISAGAGIVVKTFEYTDLDETYIDFTTVDLRVGFGGIIPLANIVQVYGGPVFGGIGMMMGDLWAEEGDINTGVGYGFEIGADAVLLGLFTLNARFQYIIGNLDTVDTTILEGLDFGYTGIAIGVGLAY